MNVTHHAGTPSLLVLVVEDDEDTRAVLMMAVRSLGHSCVGVGDVASALAVLDREGIDVVVSDWELPDANAAELCRQTRSAKGRYVYFLVVSGYDDRERLVEAATAGADDFQRKPIDLGELEMRLILASRALVLRRRLHRGKRARACNGCT